MKYSQLRILVLLAALCLESAAAISGETAIDVTAIRSLMGQTAQGFETRDLDLSLAMYRNSEFMAFDVFVSAPGDGCCGYEKVREQHKKFFDGTVGPVVTDFSSLSIVTDGDLGYAIGPAKLAFTTADGDDVSLQSRLTLIFKRLEGIWTCVHEHVSVPTTLSSNQ